MISLTETIQGNSWTTVEQKFWKNDGCIVDVGCLSWNWSSVFLNKKRVIGVDPNENDTPTGAELFKGVLGPFDGEVFMGEDINAASKITSEFLGTNKVKMLSWKTFCSTFSVDKVSILKLNIEGSEYPFLHSLTKDDFDKIEQITISFHGWLYPEQKNLVSSSLHLLELSGYEIVSTFDKFEWYLCFKK